MLRYSHTRQIRGRRTVPANDRFKVRYRALLCGSVIAAALLHGIVIWLSPSFGVLPAWRERVETMALAPPSQRESAPERPPLIEAPGRVVAEAGGPGEIRAPAEPIVADLPALTSDELVRELSEGPRFTPHDVAPALKNRALVVDELLERFPAWAPGVPDRVRAELWFLIDGFGVVRRTLIKESSGHPVVDAAVLDVASFAEFSPAWSQDRRVPVWISLPVELRVEPAEIGATDTAEAGELAREDGPDDREEARRR